MAERQVVSRMVAVSILVILSINIATSYAATATKQIAPEVTHSCIQQQKDAPQIHPFCTSVQPCSESNCNPPQVKAVAGFSPDLGIEQLDKWCATIEKQQPCSLTVEAEAVEGASADLWKEFKDYAAYAQYTPFLVALAAGTLEPNSLRDYLGLDLYYLKQYVKACEKALSHVNDENVQTSLETTIKNTREFIEQLEDCFLPVLKNEAAVDYTSFLLATAAGKVESNIHVDDKDIPLYSVCSITPCSKLYVFLGGIFDAAVDFPNKYGEWIKTIFPKKDSPTRTEQLLDKLANSSTTPLLSRIYHHALSFEIQFFSAVPLYQRTSVPLLKQGVKSNCRYHISLSLEVLDSCPPKAREDAKSGFNIDTSKVRDLKKMESLNADIHILNCDWDQNIKDTFSSIGLLDNGTQHINIVIVNEYDPRLLGADIGIMIVGDEKPSREGVSFVSLYSDLLKQEIRYAEGYTGWKKPSDNTVYTVSTWFEICAFLMGSSSFL